MMQLQLDGTPARAANASAAADAWPSVGSGTVQLRQEVAACEPMVWHAGKMCNVSIKFDPNGEISQTNRLLGYAASENIATNQSECEEQCLQYLADPSASPVTPNQGPIANACCRWWPSKAGSHHNACCIYG